MKTKSSAVQARIAQNVFKKKQELAQAHVGEIVSGAKAAAKIAKQWLRVVGPTWTNSKRKSGEECARERNKNGRKGGLMTAIADITNDPLSNLVSKEQGSTSRINLDSSLSKMPISGQGP